jgi:hypothetical protein
MVRYSFLVGLFHPRLCAGLSRRLHSLTVVALKLRLDFQEDAGLRSLTRDRSDNLVITGCQRRNRRIELVQACCRQTREVSGDCHASNRDRDRVCE